MNNTVIDSPFCSVNDPQPAISVYAGGFNLNASSPIQNNVTISGNLVLGGMVSCPLGLLCPCTCVHSSFCDRGYTTGKTQRQAGCGQACMIIAVLQLHCCNMAQFYTALMRRRVLVCLGDL